MNDCKIYMIIVTNTDTGEKYKYVGQTRYSPENRLSSHARDDSLIGRCIRKYDKVETVVLANCVSRYVANLLETRYIENCRMLSNAGNNGLNVAGGGGYMHPFAGKSDAELADISSRISSSNKGKKAWNKGKPGRKWTREQVLNRTAAHKRNRAAGLHKTLKGRKQTPEHIENVRLGKKRAMRIRMKNSGENYRQLELFR